MLINSPKQGLIKLLPIIGITVFFFLPKAYSQEYPTAQSITSIQLASVKLYRTGSQLNNPIIKLNDPDETLTLEFDDLSREEELLDYTIIHCTPNWEPSDIDYSFYSDGFKFNPINSYRYSQGTVTSYTHYTLTIPNSKTGLKISGNYILRVVLSYNHDSIVLQRRFMVVEPTVQINALIREPRNPNLQNSSQQIELDVAYGRLGNIDTDRDLVVKVGKTTMLNGTVTVKPVHRKPGNVEFTAPDALIFPGGDEFRHIDLKSLYTQSAAIQSLVFRGNEYHLLLAVDEPKEYQHYSEKQDINGKYIVKRDDSPNSSVEAEYLWVYFTLRANEPYEGDIFLYGELTDWQLLPRFRLRYNSQKNCYETRIRLKQGYYNYRYVKTFPLSTKPEWEAVEGNHFETENIYHILCYYRSPGSRYWRLVGIRSVNSRYKNQ